MSVKTAVRTEREREVVRELLRGRSKVMSPAGWVRNGWLPGGERRGESQSIDNVFTGGGRRKVLDPSVGFPRSGLVSRGHSDVLPGSQAVVADDGSGQLHHHRAPTLWAWCDSQHGKLDDAHFGEFSTKKEATEFTVSVIKQGGRQLSLRSFRAMETRSCLARRQVVMESRKGPANTTGSTINNHCSAILACAILCALSGVSAAGINRYKM